MRTILITVALAGCGAPRQPLPPTVHEQLAAMDEPIDAAVNAEHDAEVDASLAFLAEPVDAGPGADDVAVWGKLPTLALEVAGDAAEAANRRTVADVLAEDDDAEVETIENGVRVIFVNNQIWCAKSGTEICAVDNANCRRINQTSCRVAPYRACASATSRTDGKSTVVCFGSYGSCQRFRFVAAQEYDITECTVLRYRAGAE